MHKCKIHYMCVWIRDLEVGFGEEEELSNEFLKFLFGPLSLSLSPSLSDKFILKSYQNLDILIFMVYLWC